jgi:hypothetical protein
MFLKGLALIFFSRSGNKNIEYQQHGGSVPASLKLDADIQIVNPSITGLNLAITDKGDYFYTTCYRKEPITANQNIVTFIKVFSNASAMSNFSIPQLPPDIVNEAPAVYNFDTLKIGSVYMEDYNFISGYDEYIAKLFSDDKSLPAEYSLFVQNNWIPSGEKSGKIESQKMPTRQYKLSSIK